MREAMLLVIAIAAFVASAFVPGGAVDTATSTATEAVATEAPPVIDTAPADAAPVSSVSSSGWTAGAVILPRAADGQFYAEGTVNGRAVQFLVDTGATGIALTGVDALAVGLRWSAADLTIVAQGASGPVEGVVIQLDSLAVGGLEMRGSSAVIVPEGLPVSLLGQSFLSHIGSVRIEGDRMVLNR